MISHSKNSETLDTSSLHVFNSVGFDHKSTENQLTETRLIVEKIKGKAYGGVNLADLGRKHGLAGVTAEMPHFLKYWEAWCDGYREYLIGHPDF